MPVQENHYVPRKQLRGNLFGRMELGAGGKDAWQHFLLDIVF